MVQKIKQGLEAFPRKKSGRKIKKKKKLISRISKLKQQQWCTELLVCKFQSWLLQAHKPINRSKTSRNAFQKPLWINICNMIDQLLHEEQGRVISVPQWGCQFPPQVFASLRGLSGSLDLLFWHRYASLLLWVSTPKWFTSSISLISTHKMAYKYAIQPWR